MIATLRKPYGIRARNWIMMSVLALSLLAGCLGGGGGDDVAITVMPVDRHNAVPRSHISVAGAVENLNMQVVLAAIRAPPG